MLIIVQNLWLVLTAVTPTAFKLTAVVLRRIFFLTIFDLFGQFCAILNLWTILDLIRHCVQYWTILDQVGPYYLFIVLIQNYTIGDCIADHCYPQDHMGRNGSSYY